MRWGGRDGIGEPFRPLGPWWPLGRKRKPEPDGARPEREHHVPEPEPAPDDTAKSEDRCSNCGVDMAADWLRRDFHVTNSIGACLIYRMPLNPYS